MKNRKCFYLILFFAAQLMLHPLPLVAKVVAGANVASLNKSVAQQQQASALDRGYRTGYSDGYQAGWRDALNRATRDARNKQEYIQADRAYVAAYGPLEDYRDGYQQGFETGYDTGFDRRGFDSTAPADLARRGGSSNESRQTSIADADTGAADSSATTVTPRGAILIPGNTPMRVELLHSLSTDASMRGDRFEARVLEPQQYEGAIIEGRVTSVRRPGKVRGTAELQLTFDQIRLTNNQVAPFNAQVMQVLSQDEDTVGDIDREGGVRGRDSTGDDVKKIGTGAGIGAIIGAITGGGKGAAIGAVIGGAVGTGGAIASRGKEVRLERGQRLLIRTSGDTK